MELIEIVNFLSASHKIERIHILTYVLPENVTKKINLKTDIKVIVYALREGNFDLLEFNKNAYEEFFSLDYFHWVIS